MYVLEVPAFDISSCLIAQQSGANRIELCANPLEGGTTCSYGFISTARTVLQIELFAIIRSRGGDFLYDDNEYSIMKKDIQLCKDLGCEGVVIGMLNRDGSIDKKRVAGLVKTAYPMSVSFHRAFDRAANPFETMEDIIDTGCERILTSGQRPTAVDGAGLIQQLVRQADQRIIVMPGSGVNSDNIDKLARQTGAVEFHSSARDIKTSPMDFINDGMEEVLSHAACNGDEVRKMVLVLKGLEV